jgi:hypothetical protein
LANPYPNPNPNPGAVEATLATLRFPLGAGGGTVAVAATCSTLACLGTLGGANVTVVQRAQAEAACSAQCFGETRRDGRDFGWESAHTAVTRRPLIPLYTMVPRTGGYAYDVGVWDLSIVQGPFSVAPCQTLESRFATFFQAAWS